MSQIESWQGATILADDADDVVGKTLNNTYSVERIVGEGAMGRVYAARHTRIAQKYVAVKVLRGEYARNVDVLARFQREAETAASISHPNVVAVFDVDRTPRGLPYLVSEYLEGLDLGQYLKQKKKLDLATAVHIAVQLCEGLQAAHRCGVIHRDLKPSNVFLVGDFAESAPQFPLVKILDFGLSKFMDAPPGQLVTETGIVMGTPSFMPPEQAQGLGKQIDLRADIYGVGALLYVCLTGRLPFDESTPQATVLAVIGSIPPPPRAVDRSIPRYVEQVILRAMAKDPALRYQNMAALLEALRPLMAESQDRPNSSAARASMRRAKVRIAGLSALVTLGFAAVVIPAALHWQAQRNDAGAVTIAAARAAGQSAARADGFVPSGAGSPPQSAAPERSDHGATDSATGLPQPASSVEPLAAAYGNDGWSESANRYPSDPRVLRAMVFTHASRSTELDEAMQVARRLFQVAPDEAKSGDLQYLVQRAAETRGPTSELAWKIIAQDMGSSGPDVLYAMSLTKPRLAERAKRLLEDTELRQRATPALDIAYAIRSARSCSERLPLLDRAIEVGDTRVLAVLAGLSTGTKTGCGKHKRKPCWPACPEEAAQFREAIAKLSKRLRGAER